MNDGARLRRALPWAGEFTPRWGNHVACWRHNHSHGNGHPVPPPRAAHLRAVGSIARRPEGAITFLTLDGLSGNRFWRIVASGAGADRGPSAANRLSGAFQVLHTSESPAEFHASSARKNRRVNGIHFLGIPEPGPQKPKCGGPGLAVRYDHG